MHVGVIHTIRDREAWQELIRTTGSGESPEGIELLATGTSTDLDRALCLWSGPSLEAVREFLAEAIGPVADNDLFALYDESVVIAGRPAEAAGV